MAVERTRHPVTATVYLREVLDALGMTQAQAAEACQIDPAMISRMVHGIVRPDRERAMQMAAAIDTYARLRGASLQVRRDYILGWLISQEYVPRTLRAAGRRVMAYMSAMTSEQQAQVLRLLRPHLQKMQVGDIDQAAWAEEEEGDE